MPGIYGEKFARIGQEMGRQRDIRAANQQKLQKQQMQTVFRKELDGILFDEDLTDQEKRSASHRVSQKYDLSLSDAGPRQQSFIYSETEKDQGDLRQGPNGQYYRIKDGAATKVQGIDAKVTELDQGIVRQGNDGHYYQRGEDGNFAKIEGMPDKVMNQGGEVRQGNDGHYYQRGEDGNFAKIEGMPDKAATSDKEKNPAIELARWQKMQTDAQGDANRYESNRPMVDPELYRTASANIKYWSKLADKTSDQQVEQVGDQSDIRLSTGEPGVHRRMPEGSIMAGQERQITDIDGITRAGKIAGDDRPVTFDQKTDTAQRYLTEKRAGKTTKRSLSMKKKYNARETEAINWAKNNPTDPRAVKILQVLGVQ